MGRGDALAIWDPDTGFVPQAARMTALKGSNAGIHICNATFTDGGKYLIRIGGHGVSDEAQVFVLAGKFKDYTAKHFSQT